MWWNFTDNSFHFLDGDDDPSTHGEPVLLHFRQHSILYVHARREECWAKLIRDHVLLPADTVKLYDPDGKLMATLYSTKIMKLHTNHVTLTCTQRILMRLVMMETHHPHAQTLQRTALLMNLTRLILSSHRSHLQYPAIDSLSSRPSLSSTRQSLHMHGRLCLHI